MDRLVSCISALDIERHRVDRGVGTVERGLDRMGVAQIGLHRNPAVDACPVVAAGGVTRGDTDRHVACEQGVNKVPTEEACAAEAWPMLKLVLVKPGSWIFQTRLPMT